LGSWLVCGGRGGGAAAPPHAEEICSAEGDRASASTNQRFQKDWNERIFRQKALSSLNAGDSQKQFSDKGEARKGTKRIGHVCSTGLRLPQTLAPQSSPPVDSSLATSKKSRLQSPRAMVAINGSTSAIAHCVRPEAVLSVGANCIVQACWPLRSLPDARSTCAYRSDSPRTATRRRISSFVQRASISGMAARFRTGALRPQLTRSRSQTSGAKMPVITITAIPNSSRQA
jgi:hypothetical protein